MIADYFIVRKSTLVVGDLYRRQGDYEYSAGFNYRALAALAIGVVVALVGLVMPSLHWLYDYAWFVGLLCGCGVVRLADEKATGLGGD